jgi:hypothetical protein
MTINYKASSIKRSLMKSTDDTEDNMDAPITDGQVTELYAQQQDELQFLGVSLDFFQQYHEALGVRSNSIADINGELGRFFKQ